MRYLWTLGVLAILFLVGCGEDAEPTRPNNFVPLTSIEIVPPDPPTLAQGTAGQFRASGDHSGLFERDITSQVTWASSDEAVLRFDDPARPGWGQSGIPGEVVVRATLGEITTETTFTITDAVITGLTLTPSPASLPLGMTQQFTARGTFSDGSVQDLTTQVDWSSSDPTIATIDQEGLATGVKLGAVTISANFGNISADVDLVVTEPELTSIVVTAPFSVLTIDEEVQLTATGTFSDGGNADVTDQVTWASGDETVATVTAAGRVKAVALGGVNIMGTLGAITGSTTLFVDTLDAIEVTPANENLALGRTLQMIATGTFAQGATRDITVQVSWTTTSAFIVVNDAAPNKGLITAVEVGINAPVRATWLARTGQTIVNVVP